MRKRRALRADVREQDKKRAKTYRALKREDEEYRRKECDQARAWNEANREHVKSYRAGYYRKNASAIKAKSAKRRAEKGAELKIYFRQHHSENAERKRAAVKAWRLANPEKARIGGHNKRAKKRANGGKMSPGLVDRLFSEQGGLCVYCFSDLSETGYHLDHYMPIVLGGRNNDPNAQLTCPTCNCRKNAKHPLDFLAEIMTPILASAVNVS